MKIVKRLICLMLIVLLFGDIPIKAGDYGNASLDLNNSEQILYEYWMNNSSKIRPFGESNVPSDYFLADIDNDKSPELVAFFSYIGPGGPTFSVYECINGQVVFGGNFYTSSGSGIRHNLFLQLNEKGELRIIDRYFCYDISQEISVNRYSPPDNITENKTEFYYKEDGAVEISYSDGNSKENKKTYTRSEADKILNDTLEKVNKNIVFSSEWDTKMSDDFFSIWDKQKALLPKTENTFDGPVSVTVQQVYNEKEDTVYGIIRAFRGEKIWEYKTKSVSAAESDSISKEITGENSVYISVGRTIYAFDINTGVVKWTVENIDSDLIILDGYENIYTTGYFGPNVTVINKSGEILYQDKDKKYFSVYNLEIIGNLLNINYSSNETGKEGVRIINISQFYPKVVSVTVNDKLISFDQSPVIVEGRTLVPVRAVVEAMGGLVGWDEATQSVTLSLDSNVIVLTTGSNKAYFNGMEYILDVPPQVINGRTLMPIRFIAEKFNFTVEWSDELYRVIITKKPTPDYNNKINQELLSCINATKQEITNKYGQINASEYWEGGKYYIHGNLKSQLFYDKNGNYNNLIDDVLSDEKCITRFAHINEIFPHLKNKKCTIDELKSFLGEYEFYDNLDNDLMGPSCSYVFKYMGYTFSVQSDHINPLVEYIYVYKQ